MDEAANEILKEVEIRIDLIRKSLPKVVDRRDISAQAKIPWKAILYRECAIWRFEELIRNSLTTYKAGDIVASIMLTRGALESIGGLFFVAWLIERKSKDLESLDKTLMQLSLGSRTNPEMPDPINILTCLDRADQSIPGVRRAYDALSEYTHPNWAGTSGVYAKHDKKAGLTHLGRNICSADRNEKLALTSMRKTLVLFENAYTGLGEMLPELVDVCEEALAKKN